MAPYLTKGILQIWNIETHVILEKKAPVQVAVMGSGFPFKAGEEPKCMKNLQRKVKKATDVDVLFDKKKLKDGRVRWCPLIILEDYHYDSTATSSPGTSFEDTASARFIGKSIPAAPALSAIKDKDRSEPSSRAEP